MTSAEGQSFDLPRRLRSLRVEGLPGRRITQRDLAQALGASEPLISSWENTTRLTVPPWDRLEAYATFFATERSVARRPARLIDPSQLTREENERRDELLDELRGLRNRAQAGELAVMPALEPSRDPFIGSLWRFQPGQSVTIVGSALPRSHLPLAEYTDPDAPDYVELYKYADLDALLELFGHVRAANPRSDVHVRTSAELQADDLTTHLVLLGGVDWNPITAELLRRRDLPVRQQARTGESEVGGFEVLEEGRKRLFTPVLRKVGDHERLVEDIAHFYRSPSPFNEERTLTICNGMYQRGTLGAVRTLTDAMFRDRNNQFARARFAGMSEFSILSRVQVVFGEVITPDWNNPEIQLHEWSVE